MGLNMEAAYNPIFAWPTRCRDHVQTRPVLGCLCSRVQGFAAQALVVYACCMQPPADICSVSWSSCWQPELYQPGWQRPAASSRSVLCTLGWLAGSWGGYSFRTSCRLDAHVHSRWQPCCADKQLHPPNVAHAWPVHSSSSSSSGSSSSSSWLLNVLLCDFTQLSPLVQACTQTGNAPSPRTL